MSKYTTEVRYICETKCGIDVEKIPTSVDVIINESMYKIFDGFPIFSESYRGVLQNKILKHYYFREIGFETYAMWQLKLNTKMNEIMPYYNSLYLANFNNKDPFENTDYTVKIDNNENTQNGGNDTVTKTYNSNTTRELNTEDNTINSGEDTRVADLNHLTTNNLTKTQTDDLTRTETDNLLSTMTNNLTEHTEVDNIDWNKYSDTPQGTISRLDDDTYLTNATKVTNDDESTTTNTGTQSTANTGTKTTADDGTRTITDSGTSNLFESGTETFSKNTRQTYTRDGNIIDSRGGQDVDTKELNTTVDFVKDYLEHVKGKMGGDSYAKMFKEYVDALINIDLMIIDELSDLFMNLW